MPELDPTRARTPVRTESCLQPAPRQEHRTEWVLRGIFLLLGVGVLVPWNAFISAKAYFQSRLCESTANAVADPHIESTFAMVYNLSSVLSLAIIIGTQWFRDQSVADHHEPSASVASNRVACPTKNAQQEADSMYTDSLQLEPLDPPQQRREGHTTINDSSSAHAFWLVMLPLSLYLLVFSLQTLLVLALELSPSTFRWITLICLTGCGVCGSIASAGIVATASCFPASVAMNPFLSGQSLGGVIVAVANFATAVWEDPEPYRQMNCVAADDSHRIAFSHDGPIRIQQQSSVSMVQQLRTEPCSPYEHRHWAVFAYFFMGSAVLASCLVGYAYIDRHQRLRQRILPCDDYEFVEDRERDLVLHEHHKEGSWTDGIHEAEAVFRSGLEVEESEHGFDRSHDGSQLTIQAVITGDDNETIAVWSVVKGPATCIFLTFVVTLALFPGWTSSLRSARQCHESSRLVNDLYIPFTFVLFNVGDLTGRVLSAKLPWKRWHHVSLKLVVGALLRFAFFPSLFLCVGNSKNAFHDIQIDSDLYSMTVQILFAISNGFLVTTAFVHAPSLLPRSTHVQERSSELLTFAVAFGLLSGSLFSYPVSKLSV